MHTTRRSLLSGLAAIPTALFAGSRANAATKEAVERTPEDKLPGTRFSRISLPVDLNELNRLWPRRENDPFSNLEPGRIRQMYEEQCAARRGSRIVRTFKEAVLSITDVPRIDTSMELRVFTQDGKLWGEKEGLLFSTPPVMYFHDGSSIHPQIPPFYTANPLSLDAVRVFRGGWTRVTDAIINIERADHRRQVYKTNGKYPLDYLPRRIDRNEISHIEIDFHHL
jgi:hypothetical protein